MKSKSILSKQARNTMSCLMNMQYLFSELASILKTDPLVIWSCIDNGCPHDGEYINGLSFRQWANDPRLKWTRIISPVNRQNWLDTETYLSYNEKARQIDPQSVQVYRLALKRLLLWAGENDLQIAPSIEPVLPVYILEGGIECNKLSPSTMDRNCKVFRSFFEFIRAEYPEKYAGITDRWINTLQIGRRYGKQTTLKRRFVFDLAAVRKLMAVNPENLCEQRDIAAVALLYLSGMRVSAFVSLSAKCINLDNLTIQQLPELGVRTKNHKAAITSLFDIPDLLAYVKLWDGFVRNAAGPDALWYIPLTRWPYEVSGNGQSSSENRDQILRRGLQFLCKKYNLPYMSPHKLRHGNTIYGVKNSRTMEELKAVSQNLMHSSISITDGVYGNLTAEDVNTTIANLGKTPAQPAGDMNLLLQVLAKLQANPTMLQSILDA